MRDFDLDIESALFVIKDQPKQKRYRWILGNTQGVEFCIIDPGFDVDLDVTTDSRTMTWVWYGDIPLREANGAIMLDGPRKLCEAFPSWLKLNLLAEIPRRHPLDVAKVTGKPRDGRRAA